MKIIATYQGHDRHGHIMLKDLTGDVSRPFAWLNGEFSNFPDGIKPGSKVQFYASIHHRGPKPACLSDVRECQVIA